MAAATLHYWWELYEKDGDTSTVAQRCRNLWDEYLAFTEKMETPRAKRYQQVHYGHCAFLPPEERRFITEDLIRATGGLVGTPDEIIAMLRSLGVDYAQGFGVAHPERIHATSVDENFDYEN